MVKEWITLQSSFFPQAVKPHKSSSALRHEKLFQSYNLRLDLSEFDPVNNI